MFSNQWLNFWESMSIINVLKNLKHNACVFHCFFLMKYPCHEFELTVSILDHFDRFWFCKISTGRDFGFQHRFNWMSTIIRYESTIHLQLFENILFFKSCKLIVQKPSWPRLYPWIHKIRIARRKFPYVFIHWSQIKIVWFTHCGFHQDKLEFDWYDIISY